MSFVIRAGRTESPSFEHPPLFVIGKVKAVTTDYSNEYSRFYSSAVILIGY